MDYASMMIVTIHLSLYGKLTIFLFMFLGSTGSENVMMKDMHDAESRRPRPQQQSGLYHYVMVLSVSGLLFPFKKKNSEAASSDRLKVLSAFSSKYDGCWNCYF